MENHLNDKYEAVEKAIDRIKIAMKEDIQGMTVDLNVIEHAASETYKKLKEIQADIDDAGKQLVERSNEIYRAVRDSVEVLNGRLQELDVSKKIDLPTRNLKEIIEVIEKVNQFSDKDFERLIKVAQALREVENDA